MIRSQFCFIVWVTYRDTAYLKRSSNFRIVNIANATRGKVRNHNLMNSVPINGIMKGAVWSYQTLILAFYGKCL